MIILKTAKKKVDVLKKIMLLSEIKSHMMNDPVCKEICREYSLDEDFILGVSIRFDEIDVSAKTYNGDIILSNDLSGKPFNIIMRYAVHELVHAAQHAKDPGANKKDKSKEYLDKETELEAFKKQIKFDIKNRGKKKVNEYIEGLLDHHDIPKKEREDKKEELLEQ